MVRDSHTCQYCIMRDACNVYHKAIEKGDGESSGLFKLFNDKTDHLTEASCQFFDHWWKLLDAEEVDLDYIRKDIWSQPADLREQQGRCLGNLQLNLSLCDVDPSIPKYVYSFVRRPSEQNEPFLTSMVVGDPIVVSSMEGHINLAMGYISRLGMDEVGLTLTEPLRNPPQRDGGFDAINNQAFKSFIRYKSDVDKYYSHVNIQYRIDRDDMAAGMGMLRNNLVQFMIKDESGSRRARLRELIVDLKKPEFKTEQALHLPPTPHLNSDQRKALKSVLSAEDYTLILGMPGTGKTTTTAEIIRYLVSLGKSVLVAAYTHTALDNVLYKVREKGVDVLRLGNVNRVMPSLRDCVPSSNLNVKSVAAMREVYDSKKVVGVTCLGIGE